MATSKKGTPTGIYDSNMTELRVGDSVKDLDSGMVGCVDKYRNLVNTAGVKMNASRCVLTESWIDKEAKEYRKKKELTEPDKTETVKSPASPEEQPKTEDRQTLEDTVIGEILELQADIPDEALVDELLNRCDHNPRRILLLLNISDQDLVDELRSRDIDVKARKARTVVVWEEL